MKRDTDEERSPRVMEQEEQTENDVVLRRMKLQAQRADTYAEWDTEETILAVKTALEEEHDVTLIEADEECFQKFLQVQPEITFNIAEGMRGVSREAQVPAILEMLGIPYTGSDPVTLGICLDKSRAKEILSYYNIPTPKFSVVSSLKELPEVKLPFPLIVKPLHEGSSKGIFNNSVVHSRRDLRQQVERILFEYEEPALIEQFLPGREFTVALLGNEPNLTVLPIVEIRFDSLPAGVTPIYSYEAKWIWDQVDRPIDVHECPAKIPQSLTDEIAALSRKAFNVLRCRDWCRIDVRLDGGGTPYILELNPLPGILPNPEEHSCFPQAARAAGISYNSMIRRVLEAAATRYGII
ncbi:MAG TPA: D-alanine--D-alanine ligase [Bacteroidota bacterium]|nr:D-alanine--D-alanine ligase [Bacteroidota bacterium]